MIAILGTAWLAIGAWVTANWLRALGRPLAARCVWTCGAASLVVHVALAFHLVHGWDHGAAERAVARETYERTGLDWGGGIYVNHAFAALWFADAMWWWSARRRYEARPRVLDGAVQFVFLFMFVNATVVFGADHTRVPGAVLCGLGAAAWWMWARQDRSSNPSLPLLLRVSREPVMRSRSLVGRSPPELFTCSSV